MFVKTGSDWTLKEVKNIVVGKKFARKYLLLNLNYTFLMSIPYGYGLRPEHESELTKTPVKVSGDFWFAEDSIDDIIKDGNISFSDLVFDTETMRDYPPQPLANESMMTFVCTHPWFKVTIAGLTRPEGGKLGNWDAVWYLVKSERKVVISNVRDAEPKHLEKLEKEDYLIRGYNYAIPQSFMLWIPFNEDGVSKYRELSGAHKPENGKWSFHGFG